MLITLEIMASVYQTLGNIYTIIRSLSNKDSTTLSDATLLAFSNKYYYLLVRELIGLREDLYAEISSGDLVANQREYVLPIDNTTGTGNNGIYGGGLIKIDRVEIAYDGSTWEVVKHLPFDDILTPTILDADIVAEYSTSNPKYYFKDRSVWIVPTPTAAVSGGIRIFWVKRPDELSAASSIPDLPKDWLAILQEGVLYDVYRKFGRIAEARDALNNWNIGLAKMKEMEQGVDQEQQYILRNYPKNYK